MANDRKIKASGSEALNKFRKAVNSAIVKGVREALLRHKQAGNPVAVSRNGEVVIIQPDEISAV
ncbi:MAG: hypothetical protein DYH05_02640 [Acidobacteria bacterium ACB1]|nr:hypothetical protein [Pyrinomonadaceae bacterium]MCE7961375.1 hypothetical protein [Acidobacteria bacterium ACB1]RIJ94787.1 MAG: hypothetical protein DCC44_03685 [Acidobacteriota bacterium]